MQGLVVGPQGSDGEDVGVRGGWRRHRGVGRSLGSGSSEPEIFVSSLPREPSEVPEAGLPIVDRLGTRRWFGCQNKNEPSMLEDPGTLRSLVGLQHLVVEDRSPG